MKALKTAKEILKGRRMITLQRILVFLIFTLLLAFVVLFGVIMSIEGAALIIVTLLSVIALPWLHTFFFLLYRSLIDE